MEAINRNVFEVIIASISGAIGFLYAWIMRNTLRTNKMSELLATLTAESKNQSSEIRDIKSDIKIIKHNVNEMKSVLTDWKATNNAVLIRVNKVLDQLGE